MSNEPQIVATVDPTALQQIIHNGIHGYKTYSVATRETANIGAIGDRYHDGILEVIRTLPDEVHQHAYARAVLWFQCTILHHLKLVDAGLRKKKGTDLLEVSPLLVPACASAPLKATWVSPFEAKLLYDIQDVINAMRRLKQGQH